MMVVVLVSKPHPRHGQGRQTLDNRGCARRFHWGCSMRSGRSPYGDEERGGRAQGVDGGERKLRGESTAAVAGGRQT